MNATHLDFSATMSVLALTRPIYAETHFPTSAPVPQVRLYVEKPGALQSPWLVNVGHVTEGGRRKTAPHAHPSYGQVIYVRNGRGLLNLEGISVPFEAPCALLLPHDCVHGLDYEIDVDRWVITMEETYLAQINSKLPEFIQLWSEPRVITLSHNPEAPNEFYHLIRRLEREIRARMIGHVAGTEALLTAVLLTLVRGIRMEQIDREGATRQAIRLADRFRELVHQHFRENLRLQNYASKMAVSPTQLRAACVAATGMSPTKMIHARLITEAKRNLIFGDMSIEQIAYGLGFMDTAYFTRFFRKEVGQSPSQFRAAAREQARPGP
ncbi:helix-turn-helix domain-containing protein (plasmid) [Acidovorax sp. DW039]|uniref:helix-turn-helix domain-containing protein n=1 Tax=Acidovorax sp. DW039 TaxID=3095606 RepID=UPI003092229B|nr:helix-turn-helix domain-containing protein [Acidovorax sp. DW039]